MALNFTNFFLATAGAAAALVGLLFVAVSLSPERNVSPGAPLERQAMAEGAFTALTNAFFISLAALIPSGSIGWVALVVGTSSLWHSLAIGWRAPPRHPQLAQPAPAGKTNTWVHEPTEAGPANAAMSAYPNQSARPARSLGDALAASAPARCSRR